MPNNHYPRWIGCSVCGSLVFTTASRATCDECVRERYEAQLKQKHFRNTKDDIIVIRDPTPIEDGGFCRLARFNRGEFEATLRKGYFAPGMIIIDRGQRKVVNGKYELVNA